ncbi:MAG TPA: GGDEF domain-containing protein, partial [Holophaga sp.]|nr:GGDEF domain-containing protein [Holophaga sp.]
FFAERATALVLLDTGVDPGSRHRLESFAAYVDRPFRVVPTGLGHYRLVLENIVQKWRLGQLGWELKRHTERAVRRVSDEAKILDLMAQTARMGNEVEAVEHILGLFEMLFAPQRIVYAAIEGGKVTSCSARPTEPPPIAVAQAWLEAGKAGTQDDSGFLLGLTFQEELVGLLRIEDVAFPEHLEDYRRLAAPISQVCGLAISNARLYQDLHRLATTDPLTSLYNRRQFFELGAAELSRARRHKRSLGAIMLDIDHFKNVNDQFGHQAGDKVLAEVARFMREEVRVTDVCGRYGGEEFAVLLPEADLETTRQTAERVRRRLEDHALSANGETLRVTASLGAAATEAGELELDVLLGRSDVALYRAKQGGRNRVCAWEEG